MILWRGFSIGQNSLEEGLLDVGIFEGAFDGADAIGAEGSNM
jgi:hypothetical protein